MQKPVLILVVEARNESDSISTAVASELPAGCFLPQTQRFPNSINSPNGTLPARGGTRDLAPALPEGYQVRGVTSNETDV